MLSFSADQIAVLDAQSFEAFVNKAQIYLRARCPVETAELDGDALQRRVVDGMDRAARYHVEYEEDILRFLEIGMRHGPEFDEKKDWANEILVRFGINGSRKIDALDDCEMHMTAVDGIS